MMRIAPALALLLAVAVLPASAARAEDGKALYASRGCLACHGAAGAKPIAGAPNLAGQNADYLLRQMNDIAEGQRSTPAVKVMKPVIHKAGPEDRKLIADWLAGLAPAPAQSGDAAKAEKGAELFDESGCIGCHGMDGRKPLADYPILAGQRRDYLMAQIKDIRADNRSTRRVRLMSSNVRKLTDDQVELLAEYLSQVKRN
jgi:cytochrome c553